MLFIHLLILYFYVLGDCINCVKCFLCFLHSIFKSSEHLCYHYFEFSFKEIAYFFFIWCCAFLPCYFICAVFSVFLSFYFSNLLHWGLFFLGLRIVLLLPFVFCPWREVLVGVLCWFLVGGDLCLCSSWRRSSGSSR